MACYPDVQRKAQAEIDKAIGSSRLPTFEDRPLTPYIEAMLLETMRWAPVTPLGEYTFRSSCYIAIIRAIKIQRSPTVPSVEMNITVIVSPLVRNAVFNWIE